MHVVDIPLCQLRPAPWNANEISSEMLEKLQLSIRRFGLVQNLVVRRQPDGTFEVLSGNQRLNAMRRAGLTAAPCVIVDTDDARARLLAEALNRIHGEDDLGLRAELIRKAMEKIPDQDILSLLPETAASLQALSTMGQESLADHLTKWQQAQSAKLRHLQFQLSEEQLNTVQEALARAIPRVEGPRGNNPNTRGNALYLLCREYLDQKEEEG